MTESARLPDCVLSRLGENFLATGLSLDTDEFIQLHSESVLEYTTSTWYEKDKQFEIERNSVSKRVKRKREDNERGKKRQKLFVVSSYGKAPDKEVRGEPPDYYYQVLSDCYNDEDEGKKLAIAATGSRFNWDASQTSAVFARFVNKRIKNCMDPRKVVKNKKMSREIKLLQSDMIVRLNSLNEQVKK